MDTYNPEPISSRPGDDHDDDFWAAFDEAEQLAVDRPLPWYRKTARWVGMLFVVGMFATGALVPWGELIDRLDNVDEPFDIQAIADETVAESPYGWLVTKVNVRDIIPGGVGGFVHNSPADGIITVDLIGWDPRELRSTVAHEIGHLVDFAAFGNSPERRNGLPSEVWAECAAVDAGFRSTDHSGFDEVYRCTNAELEQYRFSMSLLGEICAPWVGECRVVAPIGGP